MKLGELQPKRIHDLVTVGFIFSGMSLSMLINGIIIIMIMIITNDFSNRITSKVSLDDVS